MNMRAKPFGKGVGGRAKGKGDRDAIASPPSSDDLLARAFTEAHGRDWRYVASLHLWFEWTGTHWRPDTVARILDLIRLVCRSEAAKLDNQTDARRIASAKTIQAVEKLARSDPAHAARMEDWDKGPMLLNTPAGVVDLVTGVISPSDPAASMSKITGASPGHGCPLWLRFLHEITGGDREKEAYLQRFGGYLLTGLTREQVMVFLHGPGANGKSVFLALLSHVMGSYAMTAPLDTFMASRYDRHSTELAGLQGARMVSVTETEVGRSWSEARLKTITGGDRISARYLYKDFVEYTPGYKLVVAGNHRPRLTDVGEAMRRRLHLVPFNVIIPPGDRDPGLVEKLKAEADGILGWMIEGCLEWQRIGLAPPDAVKDASRDYFQDEDHIGQWLEEACERRAGLKAGSTELFASWTAWANTNGCPQGTAASFAGALKARGLAQRRNSHKRYWLGIGLRSPAEAQDAVSPKDDSEDVEAT